MRPHGRARVNAGNPEAFGICDRCSLLYNRKDLTWQFDWAGASLINKRILVCRTCNDEQQQQLRAIVLPADPVPIANPRIEPYARDSSDYRTTSGQNTIDAKTGIPIPGTVKRITQNENTRVVQQTGEPPYGTNQEPGIIQPQTNPSAPGNDDPGLPYDFDEVPKTGTL